MESKKRWMSFTCTTCSGRTGASPSTPWKPGAFGDLDLVEYVMSLDPERKRNRYGKGKYLLRRAFQEGDYLPELLWREKAAFSDAVGHSMVDYLKEYAESRYTDGEFEAGCRKYSHARPFTKESLLYRDIFEKYYPGQGDGRGTSGCQTGRGRAAMWTTPLPGCSPTTGTAAGEESCC